MNSKHLLRSKTFWVQILAFLSALVPPVGKWISENPVEFVGALAALNVLVRFATSGKVQIFPDPVDDDGGGTGWGPGAVVLLVTASLFLLPSCSVIDSAITGEPIPSATVSRTGDPHATPVQVAVRDLVIAEHETREAETVNEPAPVWGLYDAGRAATAAREVFTDSAK